MIWRDGEGLRHLAPDQLITATPRALVADIAKVAQVAEKVGNGVITLDMLSQDVQDDINATVGLNRLSPEVSSALKPVILEEPVSVVSVEGLGTSLVVDATGGNVTYQWKRDGANLTGATSRILTISDLNESQHAGNYSVIVSNAFGSTTSAVVGVDINGSVAKGLVGWWKFDETNGTVAYDSSGNGNDGNLTNGPTWTTGKIGGALSFDGVNDFVSVAHSNGLNLVGAFSVSLWFKVNKYDGVSNGTYHEYDWSSLLTKGRWGSLQNWTLLVSKHPLLARFGFYGEDPPSFSPSFNLSLNNWCKVVVVQKETNEMYFYSNNKLLGVVSNEGVSSSSNTSHNLFIGFGNDNSYPYYLPGLIDDVRIYDRALSAFEVKSLYELGEKQDGNASAGTPIVQAEVADGSVTSSKIASNTITTSDLANRFSSTSSLKLLPNLRLRLFMRTAMRRSL